MTFHAVSPEAVPVRLVATHAEGVQISGVTRVGDIRLAFRSSAACDIWERGKSLIAQSFVALLALVSLNIILSSSAGVPSVIQDGNMISAICFLD